jgi:hypothetical protein
MPNGAAARAERRRRSGRRERPPGKSAFCGKTGREMLDRSVSVADPLPTFGWRTVARIDAVTRVLFDTKNVFDHVYAFVNPYQTSRLY